MADDKPKAEEAEPIAAEGVTEPQQLSEPVPEADGLMTSREGDGAMTSPDGDGLMTSAEGLDEATLEQMEQQLKQLEEEQSELAAQFEQAGEMKLEPHLAVIEEQFRNSFDDRFSQSTRPVRPTSYMQDGDMDLMKLNSVFREVSRAIGDEWKPVFTDLTSAFPPDVVQTELERIERVQPLIQGYRALSVWKDLSGGNFSVRDLIIALRKNNMDDVADSALTIIEGANNAAAGPEKVSKPVSRRKSDVSSRSKPALLDNRRLLLLSKKVGGDWKDLGKALAIPDEELQEISEGEDGSTYQGAFKVLWSWRQTQPEVENEESVKALKDALVQVNKQSFADELGSL